MQDCVTWAGRTWCFGRAHSRPGLPFATPLAWFQWFPSWLLLILGQLSASVFHPDEALCWQKVSDFKLVTWLQYLIPSFLYKSKLCSCLQLSETRLSLQLILLSADGCMMWALEREKKIHRDPAGSRTRDLLVTRWTLLPLSHWAHGRGVEASLHITAMLEASADSNCLSLSHRWKHIPGRWGCGPGVDWLYRHLAWADTLTIHHLVSGSIISWLCKYHWNDKQWN